MHALSGWIKQIILMIMFAMILELLLPHNRFNRYVKTVVGLILILILLSPILNLFKMPVDQILTQIVPMNTSDPIKNSLNLNKKEIESNQRAYISKQMAVQMKSYAKKELNDRYGLVIQKLDLQLDPTTQLDPKKTQAPVQHVDVTLVKKGATPQVSSSTRSKDIKVGTVTVSSVQVGHIGKQDKTQQASALTNEQAVMSFLASKWNLPANKITLHLKGGGT